MIVSKDIKIKLKLPVTNEQVENELKKNELNVLRWAIVESDKDIFTVRLSVIQ